LLLPVTASVSQNPVDRHLTILIAEDSEDYALILQSMIKALGWKNPIRMVHDGKEAINYLSGDGQYADREAYPLPSVMFIDIKMPQANGFDVLRWIRDHPERSVVPTIMLSSSDDERDVRLAYELGASAYAVKPADTNDLKAMLQAAYNFWEWCEKPKEKGVESSK
jgi:CheY-like chemotaxis protein